MSLTEKLKAKAPIGEIGAWLDSLDAEARWAALASTDRATQRALYQAAAESPPLTLEHFAPANRPSLTEVRHRGRNSLPLLPSWRFFAKCFTRPSDGAERLFGYNDSPTGGLIGPGFYVAHSTAGNADWEPRGAIVVNYFLTPDGPVVEGWPKVVPNSQGLQMFVYKGTRDFMRGVSQHVSIGAAYKGEKALDHYFVLCRED